MNAYITSEALHLYEELLRIDPTHILPRQLQLDIANRLMADGNGVYRPRLTNSF